MDSDIKEQAAPVMDVAPPPAPAPIDELPPHMPPEPQDDTAAKPPAPPAVQTKSKPVPEAPKSGVALAIVATVIIVLGLAALATYAYLKQR